MVFYLLLYRFIDLTTSFTEFSFKQSTSAFHRRFVGNTSINANLHIATDIASDC